LLTAVRAEKKGAFEYLPKPFDLDDLLNLVTSTFLPNSNKNEIIRDIPKSIYDSGPVVGKSSAMQEIYKIISRIVNTNYTVLISGDSGTGKKLIAKSIHDLSSNTNNFFIDLDSKFFDDYSIDNLLSKINAFTSINIKNINDLSGSSIYIKNVTELSELQQKNLLNFIENGLSQLFPTESNLNRSRIFVSTKKNVVNEVEKGLFREDLYYRLNIVPIKLPSLKDRFEDIPDLTSAFLNINYSKTFINKSISYEGMNLLKEHSWPGNIRELKNVIERLCLLSSTDEIALSLIKEVLSEDRFDDENK